MTVRDWPSLPNLVLPDALRESLAARRESDGVAMAEQLRRILCAYYGLRCERVDSFGGPEPASGRFTLRVSPELFRALQRHKQETGAPMRTLVLEIVSDYERRE